LLGKPEEIAVVYQNLGYTGEPEYFPAARIHYEDFDSLISNIPTSKPLATQSSEFIECLANSKRKLQFVTCRMFEDGQISIRTLPRQQVLKYIENFGFEARI
jgi:hypothetical protein